MIVNTVVSLKDAESRMVVYERMAVIAAPTPFPTMTPIHMSVRDHGN